MLLAPVDAILELPLSPGVTVQVQRYRIEEGLCRPARFEVDALLLCPDTPAYAPNTEAATYLGAPMTLRLSRQAEGPARVFSGPVQSCAVVPTAEPHVWYLTLGGTEPLGLLAQHHGSDLFIALSPLSIIGRLLKESLGTEVAVKTLSLDSPALTTPWPCRVRHQESRLDFLHRLFDELGLGYVYLDPPRAGPKDAGGQPTLILFDSAQALGQVVQPPALTLPLLTGGDIAEESMQSLLNQAILGPQSMEVRTVETMQSARPEAQLQQPIAGPWAYPTGGVRAPGPLPRRHVDVEGMPASAIREYMGTAWAQQAACNGRLGTGGQSDALALQPGQALTVVCGRQPGRVLGSYRVVSIDHTGGAAGQSAEGHATSAQDAYLNAVTLVPLTTPYRPQYGVHAPQKMGLQVATVLGQDASGAPFVDASGRVLVHVHGFNHHQADPDAQGLWARVSQAWAGNKMGAFFWPRPGMEVLLGFVGDHDDEPTVLGCTFSRTNPPPFPAARQASRSGIKTKNTAGLEGNELIFDDADGAEEIKLTARRTLAVTAYGYHTHDVGYKYAVRQLAALGEKVFGNPVVQALPPEMRAAAEQVKKIAQFFTDGVEDYRSGRLRYKDPTDLNKFYGHKKKLMDLVAPMAPDNPWVTDALHHVAMLDHHIDFAIQTAPAALEAGGNGVMAFGKALAEPTRAPISTTSIWGSQKHHVKHDVTTTVGGTTTSTLEKDVALEGRQNVTLKVGAQLHVTAENTVRCDTAHIKMTAEGDITIRQGSGEIVMAGGRTTLRRGQSALVLDDDRITLDSPTIELKGAQIKVRGSSQVAIRGAKTDIH